MTGQLRLLVAARKSRAGDSAEDERYARQDGKVAASAERDGHVVVHTVHDTVSSQTPPWQRRNLKTWMTDADKLALYDGLLVAEADRLSRTDDQGWHDIESWAYDHGKKILTSDGVQFPPRDDADRYQWLGLKRRARTYLEDVATKHADTRKIVLANKAAIGCPPFGYQTAGEKMHKRFVPDANAPVAVEVFVKIANGDSASSVARWLGSLDVKRADGRPFFKNGVRVKFVIDTIKRTSYLGERDGHCYDLLPGMTETLWQSANAVLDARHVPHHSGGRIAHNSFSGCVYCARCGSVLYRHQSTRNGKPTGIEKYQCSRGRVGATAEAKCGMPRLIASDVNAQLDVAMRELTQLRQIIITSSGGAIAKDTKIKQLNKQLSTATAAGDMTRVIELATAITTTQAKPDAPLQVQRIFGRSYALLWSEADHVERRELLARGGLRMVADGSSVHVDYANLNNDDDDTVSVPA